MQSQLLQEVKEQASYLENIFKQLHSNPELGRQEYKTQALPCIPRSLRTF